MEPKIAIAILNWNGKHWLEKFLPSVISFSHNAEIYIIDNQSDDESLSFVEKKFPSVKIIQNDGNFGFAKGYNEGLKLINADIFCLLNSDVEVTENWLEPIINIFKINPEISVIQPKILDYKNKNYFEFAGAAGGYLDNLAYPYCRGRIFENVEKDRGQYDDDSNIFWASGCAFFIRSKEFWEQGGFDERFFAHQEEIDLCWRIINSGRKIFYTSKSVVYHVGGATLNKNNPQKTFLNFRNNLTMMLKNMPFPQAFFIIFFRLILDGLAGIYLGFKMGFPHLWAVVRAHVGFYRMIPGTLTRRGNFQTKNYFRAKWLVFKNFL